MRKNPYIKTPRTARWDKAISAGFDVKTSYQGPTLVTKTDRVMSAGSCFAANIVPFLEKAGLKYLRTEKFSTSFDEKFRENFAYDGLSARYGNIYTPRQLLQLLQRARGQFTPLEDRWKSSQHVIDPFRPALRYAAKTDEEFDLLTKEHLAKVLEAFQQASVFIFTLGLTEAWMSAADGAVFPACPGTIAGSFDPEKHVFKNFTVEEITSDLRIFIEQLREINPSIRIIMTVSPVPLVATMEQQHVLLATTYSKSVLRVAADMICRETSECEYFPSYDIITGPQAKYEAFKDDRRNPSDEAIQMAMTAFLAHCETDEEITFNNTETSVGNASKILVDAECEEEAVLNN